MNKLTYTRKIPRDAGELPGNDWVMIECGPGPLSVTFIEGNLYVMGPHVDLSLQHIVRFSLETDT